MSNLKKQFQDPPRSTSETKQSELIDSGLEIESAPAAAESEKFEAERSAISSGRTDPLGIKNWINGQLTRNYGLKTLLLLIVVIAVLAVATYIFRLSRPQREDPSSPKKLARLIKNVIADDDYEGFEALFLEADSASQLSESERFKLYAGLQKQLDENSFSEDYLILGNSRGHLYLVSIEYIEGIKQYRIRSVREVPSSLRFFFQEPAGASVDDAFASELQRELEKTSGEFPAQTGQNSTGSPKPDSGATDDRETTHPDATQSEVSQASQTSDDGERS
ncbi:MAG: hypothetical protein Q4P72_05325 [Eubacteriales bacterium]|nr:hypothetical protein [Eubacteriales bacterium]